MLKPKQQPAMISSSNVIELRKRAFEIIKGKSFIREQKKLSSGRISDHYFDMKMSMLDPEGATILCDLVLSRISEVEFDFVGGLEMGAVPIIAPIAMLSYSRGRPIPAIFVRKAAKEHGTQKLIEGTHSVRGKRVVVVDDVTTTGRSAMKSIEVLREAGATVPLVLSILDRQEGAVEFYKSIGMPFQCLFTADEFLRS